MPTTKFLPGVLLLSSAILAFAASPTSAPTAPQGGGRSGRAGAAAGPNLDSFYQLGPDSHPTPNAPHGNLIGPLPPPPKVYAGPVPATTRQNGANSLTALSAASPTPMQYVHGYWI